MIQSYPAGMASNSEMNYLEKELFIEQQNRMREQIILALILIFAISGLFYSLYQPEFISDFGTGQVPLASSFYSIN